MRTHYPVDVILWGDSLPTFAWQHGETIGTVKVALGFFGSSVFEFADCPRGAASGFNTNQFNGLPLGWYVADQHPIEGRQGYTPDGVLWDVLNERTDPDALGWTRHEFCMAGTTVYEDQDSFGVWADGIADPGDDNWSGMWASTDQHGCVFHELMANPPTGRITTLGSIGHNDFVIQGHTGRGLTFDPPATSVASTIADNLADGLVAIGRAFDRLCEGSVAEHVLISSPRWPFDDLDRQSPLAIAPTPPYGYHATGVPDDEYQPPYTAPHQLQEITFPPPNEDYPGFAQEIWMGIHFQDQWVAEDSVHRRGWFDHWWADNNWPSFVSFFNPTAGGAWAAAHAYSNSFLSQFHSLGYRAAFGTANLKSDTVAPLAELAIDGGHQAAEAQLVSEGIPWRYIPGWDSMPAWAGTGPNYPHGHKSLWFDGIHMKEAAAIHWNGYLLDRWFNESIHKRITVQLSARRPLPALEARRDDVELEARRPDTSLSMFRQATRFFRLIGDVLVAFTDLTDVTGPFEPGQVAVFDGTDWEGLDLFRGFASTSFIYNSSGVQEGTRYNDWADLMTAVGDIAYGGTRSILFEQDETIPTAGMPVDGWDLNGAGFTGVPGSSPSAGTSKVITFPDGCKLKNPGVEFLAHGLIFHSTSTSWVVDLGGTGRSIYLTNDALICSQQAAFFRVSATSGLVLFSIRLGAGIRRPSELGLGGGDYESVNITGSPSVCLIAEPIGYSNLGDNVLRSVTYQANLAVDVTAGEWIITVDDPSGFAVGGQVVLDDGVNSETHIVGTVDGNDIHFAGETPLANSYAAATPTTVSQPRGMLRIVQSPAANTAEGNTQTNLTGGLYVVNQALSSNVAYTPAVEADWVSPPSTVAQALDAIAAAVGPI